MKFPPWWGSGYFLELHNRPLSLFYRYGFVTFQSEEDVRNVTEMVGITYGLSLQTLQCDHCNQGHFDKVDQSDYRRTTIHSKKVGCWQLVKENNKLLETQNLILIANIIIRKAKCLETPDVLRNFVYNTQGTFLWHKLYFLFCHLPAFSLLLFPCFSETCDRKYKI